MKPYETVERSFAAVFALVVSAFALTIPSTVLALGATPVSEINAPGKGPYQHSIGFNPGAANCPNQFFCFVTFPPVPAGKRLVVTNVSAQYTLVGPVSEASVSIGTNGNLFSDLLDIVATPIGNNRYLASVSITYFVEPGDSPSVFLSGQNVTPSSNSASVTITGYLVAVP